MYPNLSISDESYISSTNPKELGYRVDSMLTIEHLSYLSNLLWNKFSTWGLSIVGSMLTVLLRSHPLKVIGATVLLIKVLMVYLKSTLFNAHKTFGYWQECLSYYLMYSDSPIDLTAAIQFYSRSTILVWVWRKYSTRKRALSSNYVSYVSKIRDFVKSFIAYNREPMFFHMLTLQKFPGDVK